MDYSFPESNLGEGTESIVGVLLPIVARWTVWELLLASTEH
jgi:hypothetical protein